MQEKILSICIPTYMRNPILKQCLDSIIIQVDDELKSKINILIFDNCSNDGTDILCEEYAKRNSFIQYIKNEKNIGPDGNFLKILSFNLNSKFCHLMSDDDVYVPNSLKQLVEFLEANSNLDFVYLNISYFTESKYNDSIEHKQLYSNKFVKPFITKKKLFKYIKNELSFLSGMVFNTRKINLDNSDLFLNTNWLQSYILFNSTIDSNKKLGFYSKVVVSKRDNVYEPNYDRFKVFGSNYYNLVKYGYNKCGYSKHQLKKMLSNRYLKLIYWAKCNDINKSKYKDIINISKQEKLLSVLLVNKIPSFIYKLYYKVKHRKD